MEILCINKVILSYLIQEKQKEILTSVKEKINSVLNPSKPEDYDPNLT